MDKGFIINKRAQPEASAEFRVERERSRLEVARALCREGRTARDGEQRKQKQELRTASIVRAARVVRKQLLEASALEG